MILPKFDQVFSADGKTTYQMSKVKAGQYVGIIYDHKALGMRHADKIYLLNNANQKIGIAVTFLPAEQEKMTRTVRSSRISG